MLSLMMEPSGTIRTTMVMETILYQHLKVMLVLTHTEQVSKIGLVAQTEMVTVTQTMAMYSLTMETSGLIPIMMATATITTTMYNNLLSYTLTKEAMHSQ